MSNHYPGAVSTFRSGNGAAWLDLLSTHGGRYRAQQLDAIDEPHALRAWLRANGLEPTGAVTEDDVAMIATTREALHRVTVATVSGHAAAAADVRTIEQALRADTGLSVRPAPDGIAVSRPATTAQALGRLTRDAVADLTGPRRAQLRACGDDTCSSIFLDPTGRRRWCTDQSCGNRLRVRAHRARAQS